MKKLYKKSRADKIETLKDSKTISNEDYNLLKNNQINLPPELADRMIENYILNYDLPLGLAMNFMIDGEKTLIPMVTDEPSVVAAASIAGKITARSTGFHTEMDKRLVIGQSVLKNVDYPDNASFKLKEKSKKILDLANAAHPSILNYDGGLEKLKHLS